MKYRSRWERRAREPSEEHLLWLIQSRKLNPEHFHFLHQTTRFANFFYRETDRKSFGFVDPRVFATTTQVGQWSRKAATDDIQMNENGGSVPIKTSFITMGMAVGCSSHAEKSNYYSISFRFEPTMPFWTASWTLPLLTGSFNTEEVWEEGHQSLKPQLCQDSKTWGGYWEHYPLPAMSEGYDPCSACISMSGEEMPSLPFYKEQKRKHKKCEPCPALGPPLCDTEQSLITSLRLHFQGKTRPDLSPVALIRTRWDLWHTLCSADRLSLPGVRMSHPAGHLHQEYARGRPRVAVVGEQVCGELVELLEDKRTG